MTLTDLVFLGAVLFVLAMAARIAAAALRRRWETALRAGRLLGMFVGLYATVLICVALVLPRRFYAPGDRRCFDDWCAAAAGASLADAAAPPRCAPASGAREWVATIEVASVARRVRQRASDVWAELEDQQGRRYQPCAGGSSGAALSDPLDPGDSFRVSLPFRLPNGATPAGLIVHHGDFPGVVIIGSDQSFLHPPALQRVIVSATPRSPF